MKKHVCVLDIETRKVETPPGFTMPSGEPLKRRWQAFLIGIGFHDHFEFVEMPNETQLYSLLRKRLLAMQIKTIYYAATRQFDEMILKGRFTNARRAHLSKPGPWPHLSGASDFEFINLGHIEPGKRLGDIPSKDVPFFWEAGYRDLVLKHLRYDLEDLQRAVDWLEKQ